MAGRGPAQQCPPGIQLIAFISGTVCIALRTAAAACLSVFPSLAVYERDRDSVNLFRARNACKMQKDLKQFFRKVLLAVVIFKGTLRSHGMVWMDSTHAVTAAWIQ